VPRTLRFPAALTALTLAGWTATALVMQSMSTMDGPGSMGSYLWLWTAMVAAMMLPTVVPAASLATALGQSATVFVGGYVVVWTASGLAAFAAARALAYAPGWVTGGALALAAVYQLTPLKAACLRRCRSPLGPLLRRGPLAAGIEHGVVCLGCCWALMVALIALGAGSLLWMAAVGAVVFVEKVTAVGARASAPVALALLATAVWTVL
jgi:predicted metal-binding membrane protein